MLPRASLDCGERPGVAATHRARDRPALAVDAPEEWSAPPALAMRTLQRAEYFASFPFWLTAASHLPDDEQMLQQIATADDPVSAARSALRSPDVALPPALCYHVYQRLAGRQLSTTRLITLHGTCWRQEGARLSALEAPWAFAHAEIVCLGGADAVETSVNARCASPRLASRLDLDAGFLSAPTLFADGAGRRYAR